MTSAPSARYPSPDSIPRPGQRPIPGRPAKITILLNLVKITHSRGRLDERSTAIREDARVESLARRGLRDRLNIPSHHVHMGRLPAGRRSPPGTRHFEPVVAHPGLAHLDGSDPWGREPVVVDDARRNEPTASLRKISRDSRGRVRERAPGRRIARSPAGAPARPRPPRSPRSSGRSGASVPARGPGRARPG